jgi:dynein heavy chain
MANITETANRIEGRTLLFIPPEDIDNVENATLDNDLIQRLESCSIHWTRQIKEVVSESRSSSDTLEGPLEEIAFWELRNNDLSGIGKQLDSELLLRILEVLRASKSQYLKAFEDLAEEIHVTLAETKNNLLFLNILKKPCEALSQAIPCQIPDIIPTILPLIIFIWKKSDTYRLRLGVLLPKISNEIIRRCMAVIHFDNIFDGNVSSVIRALTDSIQAGLAWQSSVERMCEHVQKLKKTPSYKDIEWLVDEKTMFAHLLAFIQRCKYIHYFFFFLINISIFQK